jgi:hypothetical protein
MDQQGDHTFQPAICCGDLAKVPVALKPLCVRPQCVIWRLIWQRKRRGAVSLRRSAPLCQRKQSKHMELV